MSALDPGTDNELRSSVVKTLREHETPIPYSQLAEQLDVSDQEIRRELSTLVDQGRVSLTSSWEYEA